MHIVSTIKPFYINEKNYGYYLNKMLYFIKNILFDWKKQAMLHWLLQKCQSCPIYSQRFYKLLVDSLKEMRYYKKLRLNIFFFHFVLFTVWSGISTIDHWESVSQVHKLMLKYLEILLLFSCLLFFKYPIIDYCYVNLHFFELPSVQLTIRRDNLLEIPSLLVNYSIN